MYVWRQREEKPRAMLHRSVTVTHESEERSKVT
jgi:hypothetical protein